MHKSKRNHRTSLSIRSRKLSKRQS